MKVFTHRFYVSEAAKGLDGTLFLVADALLDNVAELNTATESSLCFYESVKYLPDLQGLRAGLVIVPEDFNEELLPDNNLFRTKKPYVIFNSIVKRWLESDGCPEQGFIHSSVVTGKDTDIDKSAIICPNVVIGDKVIIGSNTRVESNTVIGSNVKIGKDCHFYPNNTIYSDTVICDRVTIHASCSIGSDGFGYLFHDNHHQKIYHVGNVVINDDVEIGANSCIDRSTIGSTVIGKGTKIDNLVQIGHNCRIGSHSVLCAQVGLAGNTEIGDYVYLAGQVGVAGHLKIDDGAMVGAQSGVAGNVPAKAKYFGTPAIDAGLQKRVIVCMKKLPEMIKLFNRLEKERAEKQ